MKNPRPKYIAFLPRRPWHCLSTVCLSCKIERVQFSNPGTLFSTSLVRFAPQSPRFFGVFKADSLPLKVQLDRGRWVPHLRLLKLEASTYAESDERFRGYSWCRWASYSLDFDSTLNQAEGQLSFGSWRVPRSIVSVRLRRSNDGWFVGHCWFRGDPTTETFLSRKS